MCSSVYRVVSVVEGLNLDRGPFDWAMGVRGRGMNKVNGVIDLLV